MLLDELASLVEGWGHGSVSVVPASIQLGRWSGKPPEVVALIPTMGQRSIRHMGVGLAGTVYHQPHVQVYVRRRNPLDAETVSMDLFEKFDGFTGTVLGVRYYLIEAIQPPHSLGTTENDSLMQYIFNIHCRRAPAP